MHVKCTHCGRALDCPEPMLGKKVRCNACGSTFIAAAPADEWQPIQFEAPPAPRSQPPANSESAHVRITGIRVPFHEVFYVTAQACFAMFAIAVLLGAALLALGLFYSLVAALIEQLRK